ncbi:MAG: fused MFS/spermidine synthase [Lachnospiraceae bacterium]|nr:fused MFS/spermidine synthase [Lachnospiraceae bacterium]
MKKDILGNKIYLYLTEFFAGMSVMAVELGASRLLAPYFSSSQIVWTIIIGTIMIAMALGNVYGGKSADKNPDPDRLYKRILIASVWIAAIPLAGRYIIIGISALLILTINVNFLVIAAFVSCMIIFVFPLFLLGTVTPSLARYTVKSVDDSGKTVGALGAFNTIGSIIGTFLPTFVTIPAVGTSVTFLLFSAVLLILGLIYFISNRRGKKACIIAVILYVICMVFGHGDSFAFWENDLLFEGESVYNYLQVKENEKEILLSTNVLFGVQSVKRKDDELSGMYYDYAMAAPVMAGIREKKDPRMLILGMGTGTYAYQCDRYFDNMKIEGVEIDGKITDLSKQYFGALDNVPVYTYDGRAYLDCVKEKYDVIMVDAYQDISIPFQMSSVEFFSSVYDHLNEDGVMVVNMNMRSDGEDNINGYLSDTIASVFPSVCTMDVPGFTNRELFAMKNGECKKALADNSSGISDPGFETLMKQTASLLTDHKKGTHIFTDDRAPVELLGMKEIDGLISHEVSYYKNLYREQGLSAVLSDLGV